jgi:hypothetical protein
MSKYQTKPEVLAAIRGAHTEMDALLAPLTSDRMIAPELENGWSVKDALAHIASWETMLMGWIGQSRRGETVKRFIPGFTYDSPEQREPTMHRLNDHLYEKNKMRPLAEVRAEFNAAHEKMLNLVGELSPEEIFEPGRFAWCGNYPLYDWISGDTWDHYAEHTESIQSWLNRKTK